MAKGTRDLESQKEKIVSSNIRAAPANTLEELTDESNNVPAVPPVTISTSGELGKGPLESISSPIIPDTVNEVASSCGLETENDDDVNNSPAGTSNNPKKTHCTKKIKKIQKRASSRLNNDMKDDRLMDLLLDGFMDDEDFNFDYDQPELISSIKRNRRMTNKRHPQRNRRYQRRYNSLDL